MREIKARGKRKDNGEWIYGNLISRKNNKHKDALGEYTCCIVEDSDEVACRTFASYYLDYRGYKVDSKTVGQYTGLKDKNGIRIYEGDIYQQCDPNIKYLVVWHDTGFTGKQVKSSSYAGLECWKDKIEIIGNIYESKE